MGERSVRIGSLSIWYRGRPWCWKQGLTGRGYTAYWFGPFKIVIWESTP